MLLRVLLLRSSLFSLKKSNPITLAYKTMSTTHTSLDLGNPCYCFNISLKFNKERGCSESYYFVLVYLATKQAIQSLLYTKRCVQLAQVLI